MTPSLLPKYLPAQQDLLYYQSCGHDAAHPSSEWQQRTPQSTLENQQQPVLASSQMFLFWKTALSNTGSKGVKDSTSASHLPHTMPWTSLTLPVTALTAVTAGVLLQTDVQYERGDVTGPLGC